MTQPFAWASRAPFILYQVKSGHVQAVVSDVLRQNAREHGRRPDGRSLDGVRRITSRASVLPCTHGSSLFTRGETQALSVATLGKPVAFELQTPLLCLRERTLLHVQLLRNPRRHDWLLSWLMPLPSQPASSGTWEWEWLLWSQAAMHDGEAGHSM